MNRASDAKAVSSPKRKAISVWQRGGGDEGDSAYVPAPFSRQILASRLFKKNIYIELLRPNRFVHASALHSGEPVDMLISIRDEVERRVWKSYAPPP